MKMMKCVDLGGACQLEFRAETFDEIAELSKAHGMAMFQSQDAEHLAAMQKMQALMTDSGEMKKWFESKRELFSTLPEEEQSPQGRDAQAQNLAKSVHF